MHIFSTEFIIEVEKFFGSSWEPVMDSLNILGKEQGMILILCFLYLCIDQKLGARIFVLFSFSWALNTLLKITFAIDRPYIVSQEVQQHFKINIDPTELNFAMPSGHAQGVSAVWGTIFQYSKRYGVKAISLFIILGVSISRMYEGSHTLLQVLVGCILGLGTVWLAFKAEATVCRFIQHQRPWRAIMFMLAPSIVMTAASYLALSYQVNLTQYAPEALADAVDGCVNGSGLLAGFAIGTYFLTKKTNLSFQGSWIKKRIPRYVLGVLLTFGVVQLLGDLSESIAALPLAMAVSFIIWLGIGYFSAFVLPILFKKIRLME